MPDSSPFTVAVAWSDTTPTVAALDDIEVDIDIDTAPGLAVIVEGLARPSLGQSIVVDLGGVGYLDAAGLEVIAVTASQLAPSGGRLTLRSPSPLTVRLLDICAMTAQPFVEGCRSRAEPPPQDGRGAGEMSGSQRVPAPGSERALHRGHRSRVDWCRGVSLGGVFARSGPW